MKIHQPDNVGSPRLKRERFDLACRFAVRIERIGRVGETPTFCCYAANAIDRVDQVPGIDTTGRGCGQCKQARVFENAI